MKAVILPKRNEKNLLEDIPPSVREAMTFHLVESIPEALDLAFAEPVSEPERREVLAGSTG